MQQLTFVFSQCEIISIANILNILSNNLFTIHAPSPTFSYVNLELTSYFVCACVLVCVCMRRIHPMPYVLEAERAPLNIAATSQ